MPRETTTADTAPAACPFCRSKAITVPAKRTASSYWRCETCGELWHPDRVNFVPAQFRNRFTG
jgi:ribosomal protein L37AE/L43A